MALANLINSFRNVSLIGESLVKLSIKGCESGNGLGNGVNVMKEFVRHVGRDNPFKYIRGRKSICYRRVVKFPEEYTTRPLPTTKLGGRDPVTGRVMVAGIGGGHKQNYRWVVHQRSLAKGEKDIIEKVYNVRYDPCRTAKIALVAYEDKKRWIIATENMKSGDFIRTSSEIPKIPVRPNEGDCFPLGALPMGTIVSNVEFYPNVGGFFARAAGTFCEIIRKSQGRVILKIPSKHEISVDENCVATVGRVSNVDHNKEIIGTPNRNRRMGNRPRSGLWHRKDGYCGRKIRRPPPLKVFNVKGRKPETPIYQLTL